MENREFSPDFGDEGGGIREACLGFIHELSDILIMGDDLLIENCYPLPTILLEVGIQEPFIIAVRVIHGKMRWWGDLSLSMKNAEWFRKRRRRNFVGIMI